MKVRKKPVEVDAARFVAVIEDTEGRFSLQFDEGCTWIGDFVELGRLRPSGQFSQAAEVDTDTHGVAVLNPGDYLILGVEGEIYPCKASVFEATYVMAELDSREGTLAEGDLRAVGIDGDTRLT